MPAKPGKKGARGTRKAQKAKRAVRRRKLVAAVVVQGKPVAQVAREIGVTRTFASREINSSETHTIIEQMVDEHAETIRELLALGLQAVRDCVGPTQLILLKPRKGEKKRRILELPNDPRTRLIAAKRVIEIALAGRRNDKPVGETRTFTWQQFLTVYEAKRGESL